MSYHKITDTAGNCRVYWVPAGEAVCLEYVKAHGVELAQCWEGVWQIGGSCKICDLRYLEILDGTPELTEGGL